MDTDRDKGQNGRELADLHYTTGPNISVESGSDRRVEWERKRKPVQKGNGPGKG